MDVKYWPELKNPGKYRGRELFIGSVTDPYNPEEERYGRTRTLLEELEGSGARISIATKSDLILRDIDLIASFPEARVSWSVNTLDEGFRSDMDRAPSVERRLAAMKAFHDMGIRTTCFISPIFPGITDAKEIILRVRDRCNLIWLENLNLRGAFRSSVLEYIRTRHPELSGLYEGIYVRIDLGYWESPDEEMKSFATSLGLEYRTDDSMRRPFTAPPVIVNFFYHERISKSAKKDHLLS